MRGWTFSRYEQFETSPEMIEQELRPTAKCKLFELFNRPLSRRLDRCDRMIQNESRDQNGGNVYYVTMQITFLTRKFWNVERNLHCDVRITTVWVFSLTLDCNGVFAIKACGLDTMLYKNISTLFCRLHNKSVYLKMGLRKMMNRRSCKDLHRSIRIEIDGRPIELPPCEGIVILNILRSGSKYDLSKEK